MSVAVDFKDVDIIFGKDPASALQLLDSGATRADDDSDGCYQRRKTR